MRLASGRLRPEPALFLLFLLFLAFAGTLFTLAVRSDYEKSLARARESTQGTALLLAEDLRQIIETSDILMQQVNVLIADKGLRALRRSRAEWGTLWNLANAQRDTNSIWVFDSDGTPVLTSLHFGPPEASFETLGGQPFRTGFDPLERNGGLVIGPPIVDRASGRLMLPISRRFITSAFTGTMVSILDIERFGDFYATLTFGPRSTLAVFAENGDLLLRQPAIRGQIGENFRNTELFAIHLSQAPTGTFETTSPSDRTRRIISYRKIDKMPLVVAASVVIDEALAGWRGRLRWNALVAVTGLGAAAVLIWLALQAMRRNETALAAVREAHHRNVEILESISDAFFALDEHWNFTYVNATAERLWERQRDSLIGHNIWAEFPQVVGSETYRHYMRAAETRKPVAFETFSPTVHAWIEIRIYPSRTGLSVYFRDISERKRAERHQRMLLAELSHRVKNTLAVVLSIASQTQRHSASLEDFSASFRGRILALANAHSLLTASRWEEATIDALVAQALHPYARHGEAKYRAEGPEVRLGPKAALTLALALHELATNSAKYGALSQAAGRIDVRWDREEGSAGRWVRMVWQESKGPKVRPPASRGFGTDLIERSIAYELGGIARLTFHEGGLRCEIAFPIPKDTALPDTSAP